MRAALMILDTCWPVMKPPRLLSLVTDTFDESQDLKQQSAAFDRNVRSVAKADCSSGGEMVNGYTGIQLTPASDVDAIRFYPSPGDADGMLGGKFQGSNKSPCRGFVDLYEVSETPLEDAWSEVHVDSAKKGPYRWLRFLAAGSAQVAEIEFLSHNRDLKGTH